MTELARSGFGEFGSPTGSLSTPGMGDLGTTLSGLLSAAGPLLSKFFPPAAAAPVARAAFVPGGASILSPIATTIGRSILPTVAGAVAGSMFGGGGGGGELFTEPREARPRPMRQVAVRGPDDRLYWFGYLGRPVLWSGDLAAARRVHRVARRAGRPAVRRSSRRFR